MRTRIMRGFWTAACICVLATIVATAADRGDTKTKGRVARSDAEATPSVVADDQVLIEPPVPLPPGARFRRYVVGVGLVEGEPASAGTGTLVYSNRLGDLVLAPSGAAGSRVADDVATTAAPGCLLDRFVFRVSGDRDGDGSGVGPFSVNFALFEVCPVTFGALAIPGTSGTANLPDNGFFDVEFVVPAPSEVVIPNNLFLRVSFSRSKAGIVVGAPATLGFSADRYATGNSCSQAFGGFPAFPHASFDLEVYVRGDCPAAFAGYKDSNQGGLPFNRPSCACADCFFADDIKLAVPDCKMIAYEVGFKGNLDQSNGAVQASLHTGLGNADPANDFLIAGTRKQAFIVGKTVQLLRKEFTTPIPLPQDLWIVFRTSTRVVGPIATCKPASIGSTEDLIQLHNCMEWEPGGLGDTCHSAFEVSITCEGSLPVGACCDMVSTENDECIGGPNDGSPCTADEQCRVCVGGSNNGNPCERDSECPSGDCPDAACVGDSVCRKLPRINCASVSLAPDLWNEGTTCGPVCDGGLNDGMACDCPSVCVGGDNASLSCTVPSDCPAGFCDVGACNATTQSCVGGPRDGQVCCTNGTCRGSFCVGGARSGLSCSRQVDCPGGTCGRSCVGGANDGRPCLDGGDCTGGLCPPGAFSRPCGLSKCCTRNDRCCNVTEKECNTAGLQCGIPPAPLVLPVLFGRGQFCGSPGQAGRCPLGACLGQEGECTQERDGLCVGESEDGMPCAPCSINVTCIGCPLFCPDDSACTCVRGADGVCNTGDEGVCTGQPGCGNPFCCTDVCTSAGGGGCCNTHWGPQCAALAFEICTNAPANDECFDPDPDEGARLVNVPSATEFDGTNATSNSTDPGFCCRDHVCEDGVTPCEDNADCDPDQACLMTGNPGDKGVGTFWVKFVAPQPPPGQVFSSVRLDTCDTTGGGGDDSLIQVFRVGDPDRGLCDDLAVCSVSAQDCFDGSPCVLDEETACQTLIPIACNDDLGPTCVNSGGTPFPQNSQGCARNLVPNDTYYAVVGSKTAENKGKYKLRLVANCDAPPPPLSNDLCPDTELLSGANLVVPFDLSGAMSGEDSATFDCPGPQCLVTMENDIWYDWTAPGTGQVTIETCDRDLISDDDGDGNTDDTPDTSLVVYNGCDCPVQIGTEVACDDFQPGPCFLGSKVTFDVVAGTCYKIRLGGNFGSDPAGDLSINFDPCPIPTAPVTFDDPPSGVIDAGQPHPPSDGSTSARQGIRSFRVTAPSGSDKKFCWQLCENLATGDVPNTITSVVDNLDGTFKINLGAPIKPGAVSTLTFLHGDGMTTRGTFTSHPGNVDGDGVSDLTDLSALVGVINGTQTSPFGIYSEDIDRSDTLAPQDLLRLLDLFNGAAAFNPWLGTSLPECGPCCPVP